MRVLRERRALLAVILAAVCAVLAAGGTASEPAAAGRLSGVARPGLVHGFLRAQQVLRQIRETNLHRLEALLDGSGFATVPAGDFLMGSETGGADEDPVRRVRIDKGFEIGKFEVTQSQWEAVMRRAHSRPGRNEAAGDLNPSHFKGPSLPVENVSWNDVQEFLRVMNARDSRYQYRLPTEAEWEYACRAGSSGDHAGSLEAMAWYRANSGDRTHPVGQKQPNAWGLHDMHGNVGEWVQDWHGFDYYENSPASDPRGPESGSYRVYRGGCWFEPGARCRSAARAFHFPGDRYYAIGFRLVRTAK